MLTNEEVARLLNIGNNCECNISNIIKSDSPYKINNEDFLKTWKSNHVDKPLELEWETITRC